VEIIQIGHLPIHGCIACGHCQTSEGTGGVFKDDIVNEVSRDERAADG
jgi:multimeric flavodoxin WrbA